MACYDLNGTWKNELGSTMTLKQVDDWTLSGEYRTAVSRSGKSLSANFFVGSYQRTLKGYILTLNAQWEYTVKGEVKQSCTAWSGQVWNENSDQMVCTWILTSAVDPDDAWSSVTTNKDIFTRVPDS